MFKFVNVFTKGFSFLCLSLLFLLVSNNGIFAQEEASITATVSISICGNSEIEGGEVCDMQILNNLTCKDFGYEYGELSCCLSCDEYDFSNCSNSLKEVKEDVKPIMQEDVMGEVVKNDSVQEEINAKDEVANDDFVQEKVNVKEMVALSSQESSSKNDDDEVILSANDNALIDDVISGGNTTPENSTPVFEELVVIENFISRSPP